MESSRIRQTATREIGGSLSRKSLGLIRESEAMTYIDFEKMAGIDWKAFRRQRPFPWVNPQGFLTDSGFQALVAQMPDLDLFTPFFEKERKHGQKSHDRYVLEYDDAIRLPAPWQAFIEELKSKDYRRFVRRLLGRRHVSIRFHWHYTPAGCVVSPHCDAAGKLGTQIFYFNTREDWDPSWGGSTVILDDHGRFDPESSPEFDEFEQVAEAETLDNRSLIFGRRGNSWHGVREVRCPEGALRRVFIVVFEDSRPYKRFIKRYKPLKRLKSLFTGEPVKVSKKRAVY